MNRDLVLWVYVITVILVRPDSFTYGTSENETPPICQVLIRLHLIFS